MIPWRKPGWARRRAATVIRLLCIWLLSALLPAAGQSATALPKIAGESLAGRSVTLPDAVAGKVAVLVFGFTRASKTATSEWARKLYADLGKQSAIEIYQLAVLEDVPRLIRSFVISAIKSDIPENRRDHFVPVLRGEAELKKLVSYGEADDAYLILLDRSGRIVRQRHGRFGEAAYTQFRGEIDSSVGEQ